MKEKLTPKKIRQTFQNGDINKKNAADHLISLINGSDNAQVRKTSIDLLEIINYKDENVFRILENHLISDEFAIVRASAARVIIKTFLDKGLAPLEWTTVHDKSPLVLKAIMDSLEEERHFNHKTIEKNLCSVLETFATNLGIVRGEAKFFIDLEAIFSQDKQNYKINPFDYKNFEVLFNCKDSKPWLVIKNKHVQALDLNFFNWKFIKDRGEIFDSFSRLKYLDIYLNTIRKYNRNSFDFIEVPESIGKLTSLQKLSLARNNLKTIPESIKSLNALLVLDLSHNQFQEIPPILKSLKNLKRLNLKHNNIQTIPQSMNNFVNLLVEFKI